MTRDSGPPSRAIERRLVGNDLLTASNRAEDAAVPPCKERRRTRVISLAVDARDHGMRGEPVLNVTANREIKFVPHDSKPQKGNRKARRAIALISSEQCAPNTGTTLPPLQSVLTTSWNLAPTARDGRRPTTRVTAPRRASNRATRAGRPRRHVATPSRRRVAPQVPHVIRADRDR